MGNYGELWRIIGNYGELWGIMGEVWMSFSVLLVVVCRCCVAVLRWFPKIWVPAAEFQPNGTVHGWVGGSHALEKNGKKEPPTPLRVQPTPRAKTPTHQVHPPPPPPLFQCG